MAFFDSLGRALNAYQNRIGRTAEIERLQRMSDADLAARGITRDRIVHHVYRDMLHF